MSEVTGRLRTYKTELGFLQRADGSCHLAAGSTVVWASVNGPGDAPSGKKKNLQLNIDVACVPTAGDHKEHGRLKRMLTSLAERTVEVERYPRAVLTLTIQNLQEAGRQRPLATAGWAITAAGLALLDSAVCMNAVFCGVTVAVVNEGEEGRGHKLVLDPAPKIANHAQALLVFAFIRKDQDTIRLLGAETEGVVDTETLLRAKSLAQEAASEIFQFYASALQRKFSVEI